MDFEQEDGEAETGLEVEITDGLVKVKGQDRAHDTNPFTRGFRVATRKKRTALASGELAVINLESGVIEGTAEITKTTMVDREVFVKVFQATLGAFYGLNSPGAKLLSTVFNEAARRKGEDRVYLSPETAARYARSLGDNLSRATYFRGRTNLIENAFIAPSTDTNLYWINPAVFFNGDRVRLIAELVRPPEVLPPVKGRQESQQEHLTARDITNDIPFPT